ncbi:hypothetical protein [uncultured Sphingopyxis sp.]|uniref:hypothetical protein n=1 Tax=uncultured Sphingopyxis sp. TaxID=310581 RepID=UPI0025E5DA48|nr:hypothetical protein [uncultured Sphingopyxis sp.]
MADILRSAAVFEECPVFVWSDNVGMLVPRHRAEEIADLVRGAFAAHGAGPFNLRDTICRDVTDEFEFLGVNYRLVDGVAPRAYIARAKVDNWCIKIGTNIMHASLCELDEVATHIREKGNAWGWWSGWDQVQQNLHWMIASARSQPHHPTIGENSGRSAAARNGVL